MEAIIDGVLRFQRDIHPEREDLFQQLARGQSPRAMFIGCADSRVIPEMLTQQGPGSLFVVRNAGNIVPPHSSMPGGVAASIEYAVCVLSIPDIVICGHSGCGAMTAILRGESELTKLPAVARWLQFAESARDAVLLEHAGAPETVQLDALIRANVLAQLAHIATHPPVAEALAAGRLRLHGWVYSIASGEIHGYDADTAQFAPLSSSKPPAHATPAG